MLRNSSMYQVDTRRSRPLRDSLPSASTTPSGNETIAASTVAVMVPTKPCARNSRYGSCVNGSQRLRPSCPLRANW